jgi:hypothetical protein
MAPITIAGALVQQHVEALAGIALAQIVRPGAPVVYGGFTSNVDMKSGSPAFGTPEFVKAAWGSGQLARRIGVPWRSSNVNASNAPDARRLTNRRCRFGAPDGRLQHPAATAPAGWRAGSRRRFEKFIIDFEMLQMFAELFSSRFRCHDRRPGGEAIGRSGRAGILWRRAHTMSRYKSPSTAAPVRLEQFRARGWRTAPRTPRVALRTRQSTLAEFDRRVDPPCWRNWRTSSSAGRGGGAPPNPDGDAGESGTARQRGRYRGHRKRCGPRPRSANAGEIPVSQVVVSSPMQYLDKATGALRELGLMPTRTEEAPINALLQKITDLDEERITVIARTLGQASVFNEVVREQTEAMQIGQRYQEIAQSFNSIRDDAKKMVDQIGDGKVDFMERVTNAWMKISRGDIADRFDSIRDTYLDVTRSTADQIARETTILDAYRDFRGALKQAEVLALEVLSKAEKKLNERKAELAKAAEAVSGFTGTDIAERARLELTRDEELRRTRTRRSDTRSPRTSPTI